MNIQTLLAEYRQAESKLADARAVYEDAAQCLEDYAKTIISQTYNMDPEFCFGASGVNYIKYFAMGDWHKVYLDSDTFKAMEEELCGLYENN